MGVCVCVWGVLYYYPDSKFRKANMGPIWGRQDPGGPHELRYLGTNDNNSNDGNGNDNNNNYIIRILVTMIIMMMMMMMVMVMVMVMVIITITMCLHELLKLYEIFTGDLTPFLFCSDDVSIACSSYIYIYIYMNCIFVE